MKYVQNYNLVPRRLVFWLLFIAPLASYSIEGSPGATVEKTSFDPANTRPYELKLDSITVKNSNGSKTRLAVTYAIPIPTVDDERLPVLMEYLPYRKDDSMYPLRFNEMDFFAKRGFVYAYVDIRGTGGSDGKRVSYEYSDVEIEDGIQVIEKLGTMIWTLNSGAKVVSNGSVALWGQSWSAFNAFIIAGKKARDPRLNALKTIVPIHGAVNLYEGDIHYMDGIFHEDEYIVSVDHENAIPSYGFHGAGSVKAYPIDNSYITNRLQAYPWVFFYLKKQVKDNFWTKRTEFFNGPFSLSNPDDFTLPVFVIGSLLDGYRDAPIAIYEKLKAKGVPVKLAMGPSNHTLMDYASPGPVWEWRYEVSKWLYYWLVNQSDDSLIKDNEFAVYIRKPGNDGTNVPGYWRNQNWPSLVNASRFYLTDDHRLSAKAPAINTSLDHTLEYKPAVGTEMGVWWGEAALGNMAPLDADSLVYDLNITENQELVGFPEVSLRVAATSMEHLNKLLANWHVRLEDVSPTGKVTHVTGASINGAYRVEGVEPSFLQSGRFYNLKLKLHFTTWTFKRGHKARLAITNALYRMMWPSSYKMFTSLKVNYAGTSVTLPLTDAADPPTIPHLYATQNDPAYAEPADGWYFAEGGYPREYNIKSEDGRKIVTWKSDYYSNCYGWIIGVELDHEFSQNETNPNDTIWNTYARQKYEYVGVTDQQLWGKIDGVPSLYKPGPGVPDPQRTFTLDSYMTIRSDAKKFYGTVSRTLTRSDGAPLTYTVSDSFDRIYQ